MLNRRSLIGAIVSSPITGPEIAKAAIAEIGPGLEPMLDSPTGCAVDGHMVSSWDVIDRLNERSNAESQAMMGQINPAIATKRSWSVAFKAHCHADEQKANREIREELQRSQQLVETMAKALGIHGA